MDDTDLFKTAIRLEYGTGLDEYRIVHLELFSFYSKAVTDTFKSAEEEKKDTTKLKTSCNIWNPW